jgi:hypothetical protein
MERCCFNSSSNLGIGIEVIIILQHIGPKLNKPMAIDCNLIKALTINYNPYKLMAQAMNYNLIKPMAKAMLAIN